MSDQLDVDASEYGTLNSGFPRPRLAPSTKAQIIRLIIAASCEEDAVKVVDVLWGKLRGDMQDRITGLISVALGAVEAKDMNARRDSLRRALRLLRDTEAAAMVFPPKEKKKAQAGASSTQSKQSPAAPGRQA